MSDRVNPAHPTPSEFARPPMTGDLTPAIKSLMKGKTLTTPETTRAFEVMMSGEAHHGEIGAFLALLATRTPTSEEILGAARVMRENVTRVPTQLDPTEIVDTAGTGGAPKTFNVSTVAAIIAAAAGAKVAKHGNRSRTGRGSAEVLQALGVNVDASPEVQAKCLDDLGISFCFAIHHHPATKHVMPVRKALGFPTIFNLLGPLTNPAGAKRQVMGVYDRVYLSPIAEALRDLGAVRAMIVHSEDGMDEISINAPTHIMHIETGTIREETIDPKEFGIAPCSIDDLTVRDLNHAAELFRNILTGKETGPARNIALLNAAATLVVAGMAESLADGMSRCEEAISAGDARDTLTSLIQTST